MTGVPFQVRRQASPPAGNRPRPAIHDCPAACILLPREEACAHVFHLPVLANETGGNTTAAYATTVGRRLRWADRSVDDRREMMSPRSDMPEDDAVRTRFCSHVTDSASLTASICAGFVSVRDRDRRFT